jgi:hypothetical protein
MPPDFPTAEYESVHARILPLAKTANDSYANFAAAWNAVAYRFMSVTQYERSFSESISATGAAPDPQQRNDQERDLFGFFSNGFSVFEATFYAVFSLGAILAPELFPLATPKDQQRVSPLNTLAALKKAFAESELTAVVAAVQSDPAYLEWREVRNILTHRAAPGRHFFVGIGGDETLADQWKLKDIPLDRSMAPKRREELAHILTTLLQAIESFVKEHF